MRAKRSAGQTHPVKALAKNIVEAPWFEPFMIALILVDRTRSALQDLQRKIARL